MRGRLRSARKKNPSSVRNLEEKKIFSFGRTEKIFPRRDARAIEIHGLKRPATPGCVIDLGRHEDYVDIKRRGAGIIPLRVPLPLSLYIYVYINIYIYLHAREADFLDPA